MKYTVFVEQMDGSGRITLTVSDDGQAAGALAQSLVSAAYGVSLAIGITVEEGDGPTPTAARTERHEVRAGTPGAPAGGGEHQPAATGAAARVGRHGAGR